VVREDSAAAGSTNVRRWWTKKWLLVGVTGLLLTLSAGVAARFFILRQEVPPQTARSDGSAKVVGSAELLSAPAEWLPDFLVPLRSGEENVLLRVSLAIHWLPAVRARYMERQVAIRSQIYHRLVEIIATEMISTEGGKLEYKQKKELEGEITRIFEGELGPGQLMVLVKEANFM
jgi:hypothetical protein